jgi:hypothetical protein
MAAALFVLQTGVTLALVGLGWFVQVVHYPLLVLVGAPGFQAYQAEHVRRVTWVAAPLMLLELAGALGLLASRPGFVPEAAAWLGAALVGAVWASTFLLQVPAHERLRAGFDAVAARRLVSTSWVRTLAWTGRAGLLLACLVRGLG